MIVYIYIHDYDCLLKEQKQRHRRNASVLRWKLLQFQGLTAQAAVLPSRCGFGRCGTTHGDTEGEEMRKASGQKLPCNMLYIYYIHILYVYIYILNIYICNMHM